MRGIRERMVGGQRSKALRGELKPGLPIGLAYTDDNQVVMDPNQFFVEAIDLAFKTFRRLGSAMQVTKWFRRQGIRLPSRARAAGGKVFWGVPDDSQIQRMLQNPRYAGCLLCVWPYKRAYAPGRNRAAQQAAQGQVAGMHSGGPRGLH